jgi:hypothetical protein
LPAVHCVVGKETAVSLRNILPVGDPPAFFLPELVSINADTEGKIV